LNNPQGELQCNEKDANLYYVGQKSKVIVCVCVCVYMCVHMKFYVFSTMHVDIIV